jgi:phenylpyruvate tautomerase PptA (4-oxalocrotonate tautomerase family)
MPLLHVTATPGAVDADRREAFIAALTAAAWRAESIPDDPLLQARAVVLWMPAEQVRFGGHDGEEVVRAVFVTLTVSDGVLDPIRRDRFAADLHAAAVAATDDDDQRVLHTQVIFNEVPEGRWGRDGAVVRLPQIAAQAGFEHLTAIARP